MDSIDDDDEPWASPEIQLGYEAALGCFILEFNHVDILLEEVIKRTLGWLDRSDLVSSCAKRDCAWKITVLDLLKLSRAAPAIVDIPIQSLRQISGERNVLAHGHFDQNPCDGSYQIVTRRVTAEYSVERLRGLTGKAAEARDHLRHALSWFDFDEAPWPEG